MDKEQVKSKIINAGQRIDDWVKYTAVKHNHPEWIVYLSVIIVVLAVAGLCWLAGVL